MENSPEVARLSDREDETSPKRAKVDNLPGQPESVDQQADDSDSSDDKIGPVLPKDINQAEEEARRRLSRAANSTASKSSTAGSTKREEWMLVPPSEKDSARSQADPLQLKNKKFLSGKVASSVGSKHGDNSWMETEAERKTRIGEEMMGLRPKSSGDGAAIGPERPAAARDLEMEKKVKEYNEKIRGKSLVEQYQEGLGKKPESTPDDPSKRAFDYEKDIASGGKIMSASSISEMSKRAGGIDSRFSRGKFL